MVYTLIKIKDSDILYISEDFNKRTIKLTKHINEARIYHKALATALAPLYGCHLLPYIGNFCIDLDIL